MGGKSNSRSRSREHKQHKKPKSHQQKSSQRQRGRKSKFTDAPPEQYQHYSSSNRQPPQQQQQQQSHHPILSQQPPPHYQSSGPSGSHSTTYPSFPQNSYQPPNQLREDASNMKALLEMKNKQHVSVHFSNSGHDGSSNNGGGQYPGFDGFDDFPIQRKNDDNIKQQLKENFDSMIQKINGSGGSSNYSESLSNIDATMNLNQYILLGAGITRPDSNHQKYTTGGGGDADDNDDIIRINVNPMPMTNNVSNPLTDMTQIRRKITVPTNTNFNYTGLIIGPKGTNQKRLEEITGCKILVRGKGSQKEGQPPQPDDNEDQHVLIVGDTDTQVAKAVAEIERIIFADEETRNKIRQEQLRLVAQMQNDTINVARTETGELDASLTTPYGPPNENAYIIPVPKDCVGLVIGKGGETIRMLQERTGARRVQVALQNTPGTDFRNVFVEGDNESVEQVKRLLNQIVDNQKKMKLGQSQTNRLEVQIPIGMVGLVIGKQGDTVRSINQKTGAYVALSKDPEHQNFTDKQIMLITGQEMACLEAKREIQAIVDGGIKHQQHKILMASGAIPGMSPFMNLGGMPNGMHNLGGYPPNFGGPQQGMMNQGGYGNGGDGGQNNMLGGFPPHMGGQQQMQFPPMNMMMGGGYGMPMGNPFSNQQFDQSVVEEVSEVVETNEQKNEEANSTKRVLQEYIT